MGSSLRMAPDAVPSRAYDALRERKAPPAGRLHQLGRLTQVRRRAPRPWHRLGRQ